MNVTALTILIRSLILVIGLVDDLRSKKVHNKLVLALLFSAFIATMVLNGPSFLPQAGMSFLACSFLMIPLVYAKILGAGDYKLMLSFSLLGTMDEIFWVLVYSLIWGSILGLIRAAIAGQTKAIISNIFLIAYNKGKQGNLQLHKMPYTIPLLFGWLSHLVFTKQLWTVWYDS